jgi:hypothetical protein
MKNGKIYIILTVLFIGLTGVFSEVILMNNNDVVKGKIVDFGDTRIVVRTSYGEVTIEKSEIKKIYLNETDFENENPSTNKAPVSNEETEKNTKKEAKKEKDLNKEMMMNNLNYFTQKRLIPLSIGFMVAGFAITMPSLMMFSNPTLLNPISLSFFISLSASGLFLQTIGLVALINGCIAYAKYVKTKDNVYESSDLTENYQSFFKLGTGFLIPGSILTSIGIGVGIPIFLMPTYMYGVTSNPSYTTGISWMAAVFSLGVVFDILSIVFYGLSNYNMKKWKSANTVSYDFGLRNDNVYTEMIIKL